MMNLPLNIDFTGKVVVVTGAGGVLCGTMARAFAQAGAKVAALDLNEDAVKKLSSEIEAEGFICRPYKANVLDGALPPLCRFLQIRFPAHGSLLRCSYLSLFYL